MNQRPLAKIGYAPAAPAFRHCRFSPRSALRDAAKGGRLLRANGSLLDFTEHFPVRAEEAPPEERSVSKGSGATSKRASAFIDSNHEPAVHPAA